MRIEESGATHHLVTGVPEGLGISKTVKRYSEVASLYEKPREDDPVVYEVYTQDLGPHEAGNLYWGLTVLKPIDSHGECNMTRGHFHEDRKCAEYYFCLRGEGLLLLMDAKGETWAERLHEGSLHHIDGSLAHRCVNTSSAEELWIGACWPVQAGHDYRSVEQHEFGFRIKRVNGDLVCEPREGR